MAAYQKEKLTILEKPKNPEMPQSDIDTQKNRSLDYNEETNIFTWL